MTDDPFLLTLTASTHDLGGFKVHRTLPHRERTTIGPFIFFDQMGPAKLAPGGGIDVRPHPHINLAEGEAELDGLRLEPTTLYVLRPGITARLSSSRGAHVMICGGAPIDGPRHVWWNFVSSSRERINQAKSDWKSGRFALPPDDHDEYIPLPEVAKTVSYP